MMADKSRLEPKIGTFVLIGLAILGIIIFSIKDVRSFFQPRQRLRIVFNYVSGIKKNSPVRLAGIEVGEVEEVKLFYNETLERSQVEVVVSLNRDVQVRADFKAFIASLGLLGEKYIEIIPGTKRGAILGEKDMLAGYVPPSMEEVTESGQLLIEQLRQLIGSFNQVIGDETLRNQFKGAIANSEELTEELRQLVQSANGILEKIESGEGTIGRLVSDEELYKDIRDLVDDVKRHPWKLLWKTRDIPAEEEEEEEEEETAPAKEEEAGSARRRRPGRIPSRRY